jgi:hypothetical protein
MSRDVASFVESGAELVNIVAPGVALDAAQLSLACVVRRTVVIHFAPAAMGVPIVATDGEKVGTIDVAVNTTLNMI